MTLSLIIFIALGVVAVAAAVYSGLVVRDRREVFGRVAGDAGSGEGRSVVLRREDNDVSEAIAKWAKEHINVSPAAQAKYSDKLVQAGYDSPDAPVLFATLRLALLIALPTLAFLFGPRNTYTDLMMAVVVVAFTAYIAPVAILDRKIRQRQERLRRSVPDALDLLVVCVEAGISLDAAILRVAREVQLAHADLAREFAIVNRKTNAGMPREEALRGLWMRTGVDDLRALVSSMIQSEKWGTSIATVLRIASETLRRQRRQAAEKKAAMAPLKMTIPLVTLVLPSLFIVILGPAAVLVYEAFSQA